MWEISYSWKSPNFPSSQNFLKHMYPGDWTKEVQSVYTVFYAPDLFLKNAELPATSTHRSGLKECSGFMYQLYSLSQSEAGIAIPIWGIKNTLSYPSKICYSLWYFSYLFLLQKIEQKQMDTTSRLVWILSVASLLQYTNFKIYNCIVTDGNGMNITHGNVNFLVHLVQSPHLRRISVKSVDSNGFPFTFYC